MVEIFKQGSKSYYTIPKDTTCEEAKKLVAKDRKIKADDLTATSGSIIRREEKDTDILHVNDETKGDEKVWIFTKC